MESRYFKRDISWLSFNQRVLMEADDDRVPLMERLNFVSIFSSNLEEFYKVRVADHKAVASGLSRSEDETVEEATALLADIRDEVSRQVAERTCILRDQLIPALRRYHLVLYQSPDELLPQHRDYVLRFFRDEVFPYLAPVPVSRDRVLTFLRGNRLYLAVCVLPRVADNRVPLEPEYFVMKQPFSKVPRFVELPMEGRDHYVMFLEDVIKVGLPLIFPGYDVQGSHCIKISRDADVPIDELTDSRGIMEQLKRGVKRRKTGAVCRFMYEASMPLPFLHFLMEVFRIGEGELMPVEGHLNLEDLSRLPNPGGLIPVVPHLPSMRLACLGPEGSVMDYVRQRDLLIHYPYHSFDHFIHFLYEAAADPLTRAIMVTQYRVAENSAVIGALIAAAQAGKRVTVFVELKARFDEENNLATAEMMRAAGIETIFSIPGLKVHAKVALVLRRAATEDSQPEHFAYISTGNFNEKTATLYADSGLFTCHPQICADLHRLFRLLHGRGGDSPTFRRLLVARHNLIPGLEQLIAREEELARQGRGGRIILKMNALQDPAMIERLYQASGCGVEIDLIVRGICCLIPGREFSRNIRVTRIVDSYLEHARIWYFGGGGHPRVYLGSPDWMRRNLYRRIEAVTPVLDPALRRELIEMLLIQLRDCDKACWVDSQLHNVRKRPADVQGPWLSAGSGGEGGVVQQGETTRAQYNFYAYLKAKNESE